MVKLSPCPNCHEEIYSDSDFCPHCGVLFEKTEKQHCERHSSERAIGICIICRSLRCIACLKRVGGKFLCEAHVEVEVREDWACVFESTDINEAELIHAVLKENTVNVLGQNFNSVGFVWDGGGDSSISRSNLSKAAKVFVPIPEFERAKTLVEDWIRGGEEFQANESQHP